MEGGGLNQRGFIVGIALRKLHFYQAESGQSERCHLGITHAIFLIDIASFNQRQTIASEIFFPNLGTVVLGSNPQTLYVCTALNESTIGEGEDNGKPSSS